MAGCEDHNVVLEKIETLCKRLDKTENRTDLNTTDIQTLKENKATNDEKFDRVFYLLGELKSSIDSIGKTLKEKNERLPNMVYSVGGVIIGSVFSGMMVWLLTK